MGDPIETVRQIYDAFGRRDAPAALALIDSDVEIEYDGIVPDACGSYRGHGGMGKLLGTILSSFKVERFEVKAEQLIAAPGDRVVVGVHQRGVGAQSGVEVEIRIGQVWTVRDGKAVRWQIYPDLGTAAAEAELELPPSKDP